MFVAAQSVETEKCASLDDRDRGVYNLVRKRVRPKCELMPRYGTRSSCVITDIASIVERICSLAAPLMEERRWTISLPLQITVKMSLKI